MLAQPMYVDFDNYVLALFDAGPAYALVNLVLQHQTISSHCSMLAQLV